MDELEILRIMNKYNPWWNNKKIPASKTSVFKRGDFYIMQEQLLRKEITSLVGPRRVGKTILIHQLIQHLLDTNIEPSKILYLSVDEVGLTKGGAELGHILDTYSKFIIKKPLDELEDTCFLFLDEIQELPDWEKILKNWYDLRYKMKVIISGSSSIWISKGSEESLLGRIKMTIMMPLRFSEVLRYRGLLSDDFYKTRTNVRTSILKSIQENNLSFFRKELDTFVGIAAPLKEGIEIELNRYLTVGGYPELLDEKDYNSIGEAVRDKVKLIFYKDVIRYFKIRNPGVLQDLFKILAKNTGQQFNIAETARLLDIERPTLRDYIKYLIKAYLIERSEFYSDSRHKRIRKQEKIYVLDAGIRNGIVDFIDDNLIKNPAELGLVVQSTIFDHLTRLKFNVEPGPEPEIFYWKDKKEIDFVLTIKRKPIPVESKFSKSLEQETVRTLKEFTKKNNSPFGIIITKTEYGWDENILKIPLWMILTVI